MGPIESQSVQGSVPSEQSAQQTVNPAEILSSIFSKNQGELEKAAVKANTPIPGGHATGIPATMTTPRAFQPGQLDHRETVGAGNARAQGIGNSVIAVMNAIAGTETALDNKKKLEVASATQQLITAQQAYDQANQLYKQDPQNADAKAAMERNKNVMNGILSNDKVRKAIAKGMNVDFTDPKANDTLEHQGVAQGKEMAKQHVDYAEQFNKQTPQVMAPNQQAIAAYQAKLQEQKLNMETMKAVVPFLRAQMAQQTAENQIKGHMEKEVFTQGMINARALAKSQDDWDRMKTHVELSHNARMSEIYAEGSNQINTLREKLKLVAGDPTKQDKIYSDFQAKSTSTISSMTKNIADMEARRYESDSKKAPSKEEIPHLDQQIGIAKQQLQTYKDFVDANNSMRNATMKGGSDGGSGAGSSSDGKSGVSSGTPKTLGSASTYLTDPSDSVGDDSEDDVNVENL